MNKALLGNILEISVCFSEAAEICVLEAVVQGKGGADRLALINGKALGYPFIHNIFKVRIRINAAGMGTGFIKFFGKHIPVGIAEIEEGSTVGINEIFAAVGGNKAVLVNVEITLINIGADGAGNAV